jgi:hypothetical protein
MYTITLNQGLARIVGRTPLNRVIEKTLDEIETAVLRAGLQFSGRRLYPNEPMTIAGGKALEIVRRYAH